MTAPDLDALEKLADALREVSFHNAAEAAGYGFASVEGEKRLSADLKALIAELREARGLLAMVSAQARVGHGDKPVLKSKRINLPAVLWHQVNAFLGGSRGNAQVDAEELKEARRLMKPFAVYYEINDLDERAADDAIEVPVGDLRLVRAFLARNGKGEGQ